MTKPAAQEPQYNCAHHGIQRGSYCIKCGAICVPATPAPSQPAGARPRDLRKRGDDYKAAWELAEAELEALAQQTAAKDAETKEYLRAELDSIKAGFQQRAEAAERERDSLREAAHEAANFIDGLYRPATDSSKALVVKLRELAALKAGKDGQK